MCIVLFPHYQELLAKKCAYNLVYESWILGTAQNRFSMRFFVEFSGVSTFFEV